MVSVDENMAAVKVWSSAMEVEGFNGCDEYGD